MVGDHYGYHLTSSNKVGYEVDFIFLALNPFDNIENTKSIELVLNNGKLFKPNDLIALLEHWYHTK